MFESEYYTTWEKYQEEHLNISDNACKTEKIPVSYTHLDVYKRQQVRTCGNAG